MIFLFLFFTELILLFFLSRLFTKEISKFLNRFIKSPSVIAYFLAFLFLPGTFFHEFAHLFMAKILQVPTGEMEFIPKVEGNSIKLGSLSIGKTNPFFRFLIGIAPFILGTSVIFSTVFYFGKTNDFLIILAVFYILFEVGNTMFSSKKDLEGAFELLLALILLVGLFYFFGFRIPSIDPSILNNSKLIDLFRKASILLFIPIGIDLSFISLSKLFLYLI